MARAKSRKRNKGTNPLLAFYVAMVTLVGLFIILAPSQFQIFVKGVQGAKKETVTTPTDASPQKVKGKRKPITFK